MTKRKALGKGLSALIPDVNKVEEPGSSYFQCPVEEIEPNPYQPRQEFAKFELDELVASIKEKGVITPLLVSKVDEGYQLIAGERRWRASQMAGLDRVPVVVRETTPMEALELALIENIHRADLNPIEEALAYQRCNNKKRAVGQSVLLPTLNIFGLLWTLLGTACLWGMHGFLQDLKMKVLRKDSEM
ncbi:ParB/RepB/Spo0J family partition protein [Thermodesulfobacteriota bacterium]